MFFLKADHKKLKSITSLFFLTNIFLTTRHELLLKTAPKVIYQLSLKKHQKTKTSACAAIRNTHPSKTTQCSRTAQARLFKTRLQTALANKN